MSLLTSLKHASSSGASASAAGSNITLSASRSTAEEGEEINFFLSAPSFDPATVFPYTITGITQADLYYGSLTGNFTTNTDGTASISITLALDENYENETLTLTLDGDYSDIFVQVTLIDTSVLVGEVSYTVPGTYYWTCPEGVTSVSAVAIGGGGGGTSWYGGSQSGTGGGGGGLGYRNNIAVTPGNTYTVVVGAGGAEGYGATGGSGGLSYFIDLTTAGYGGAGGKAQYGSGDVTGGAGGTYAGTGGGAGGTGIVMDVTYKTGQCGGGSGAGGYGGTGGYGGGSTTTVSDFSKRAGGNGFYSGAGGGMFLGSASVIGRAGAGGGTGLYGTESSSTTTGGAVGGSDGQQYGPQLWTSLRDGANQPIVANQQRYGGGAPARNDNNPSRGSSGAVRIMWGGGRSFPTNAAFSAGSTAPKATYLGSFTNPNPDGTIAGDSFGYSVSIDGNFVLIGSPSEDTPTTNSGLAYLYDASTRSLLHTFTNPNSDSTSDGDFFGRGTAMHGNYLIVGAPNESYNNGGGTYSGAAYIFNTDGEFLHTLVNPNAYGTKQSDQFGNSVAMWGNYAAISGFDEEGAGGENSAGAVYVYEVSSGTLLYTLASPNPVINGQFGYGISIHQNYLAIGEPQGTGISGTAKGCTHVYDITTGTRLITIDSPTASYVGFGEDTDIDGDMLLIGAKNYNESSNTGSGRTYLYNWTTGTLIHTLINPNVYSTLANDNFGFGVALSGQYMFSAAPGEVNSNGVVYPYRADTGVLGNTIYAQSGSSGAMGLLNSIAASGNYMVVGSRNASYGTNTIAGLVSIYKMSMG